MYWPAREAKRPTPHHTVFGRRRTQCGELRANHRKNAPQDVKCSDNAECCGHGLGASFDFFPAHGRPSSAKVAAGVLSQGGSDDP